MPLYTIPINCFLKPGEIYGALRTLPFPVLLESALVHRDMGRYSFVAADPFLVFEVKNGIASVNGLPQKEDPLSLLGQLLNRFQLPHEPGLPPFYGGAVGFFSYDLGRILEILPNKTVNDINIPDCMFCFYDTVVAVDHLNRLHLIISSGFPEEKNPVRQKRARKRAELFQNIINEFHPVPEPYQAGSKSTCYFDKDTYCQAVEKVRQYILAGDIFQVNLSQRFSVDFSGSPYGLYQKLAEINPAPFAALLEWGDFAIASASPERFLELQGSQVETRPIKGTRPRGKNPGEDVRFREELWNSSKDRAELTMIADLERNDLGRVCRPGTVQVPELFRLEQYATVWHLVSTVTGELKEGMSISELIRASFPGGSITGAPKIRAMEIIEELEPVKRGIYTGSIGYLGFNGRCDLNIVIRTFVIKNVKAHIQVGGGITVDSVPEDEYQETLDKAEALFQSLNLKIGG